MPHFSSSKSLTPRPPLSLMSTEMYSLLIDAYVKDNQEKNYLFKAIQNIP